MNGPFYTRQDVRGPKPGATHVKVKTFDEFGRPRRVDGDVIINTLAGSDGGRSEAKRLCSMLNEAWERFHTA